MIDQILNALTPEEIFGKVSSSEELRQEYRRLSKLVHPDLNPTDKTRASSAFGQLVTWVAGLKSVGASASSVGACGRTTP
jgi:hypothetical protein